jgi:hypothetical protein
MCGKKCSTFSAYKISCAQDCFEITKEGKTGNVVWWSK